MANLLSYLKEHTLVWLIPLIFVCVVLGGIAWKVARTPSNPFIYDI